MILETLLNGVAPSFGDGLAVAGETAARVAAGTFFAFSGFHKLFNSARHATLKQTLEACGIPCIGVMQWFVPGVEFFAGLGVAFGFLTPLSALGLIAICLVASCTDGKKRVRAWKPVDVADRIDDWLYLPEVLYIVLLVQFVLLGAGPVSLDNAIAHLI